MFLEYLNTPQIVFYFYFIAVGILNIVFQCIAPLKKASFLRGRIYLIYMPCVLFVLLQITSLVFFLRKLDEINDKTNNMYPVDEETQLLKQYFVVVNLLLYYLIPLFMVVSLVAHTIDAGRAVDAKNESEAMVIG